MNHRISSWLRNSTLPLALVCLAGPALASRTVTSSDTGGGGPNAVASSNLIACNTGDAISGPASACSGFFDHGEQSNAVQALVGAYDGAQPAQVWNGAPLQIDSQISGAASTTSLFTTSAGPIGAEIRFNQFLAGNLVVVLSGTWMPVIGSPNTEAWSAYYLFDDVEVNAYAPTTTTNGQSMTFWLFGDEVDVTTTPGRDAYLMNGLNVGRVSIYQYDVTRTATVPEPSSLLLSGLALGALGAAAALARRRRLAAGGAPAL